MENIDIWNKGLTLIKKNLNNDIFELWFKPTTFKSYDNGEVNISVPNRYCGEWLKTNYYGLIRDALINITQEKDIKINFVPAKEREKTEEIEIIKQAPVKSTLFQEKRQMSRLSILPQSSLQMRLLQQSDTTRCTRLKKNTGTLICCLLMIYNSFQEKTSRRRSSFTRSMRFMRRTGQLSCQAINIQKRCLKLKKGSDQGLRGC